MGKESIIAQVDSSTEQIMRNISDGITSAIDGNLRDIKDDTKAIEDIVERTEEITQKLSGFDGLSSSLADLKAFAEESKQLSEKISPLESQLKYLHNSIDSVHNVISSVEKIQSNKFEEVSEELRDAKEKNLSFSESALQYLTVCKDSIQLANEKFASLLSSLVTMSEKVETTKSDVSQLITTQLESTFHNIKNESDSMKQNVAAVSLKLQEVDNFVHQRTDELDTRIEAIHTEIQVFGQQNEAKLNMLKESLDKIQVTLDIVVNLTTPFWKKWGK